MTQLIRVYETGDKEVMKWESMELADPGHGEIQIAHTAIGLNFIDVYFRTGTYPAPLPFTPGLEAAGIVEKIGAGVEDLKVGDRVAYAATPLGAYAESRNIEAAKEVIDILENMEPLSKVHFNIDMYMITKAHGEYLTNNNKFSHRGENNSTLSDRFNNINVEDLSENITNVGFRRSTFKPLIIQLLIDSGIENRSHRKNLLDPNDKFISIYIGKKICVQNFAK